MEYTSTLVGRVISNPWRTVLLGSGAIVTMADDVYAARAAAISSGVAVCPLPAMASANCLYRPVEAYGPPSFARLPSRMMSLRLILISTPLNVIEGDA